MYIAESIIYKIAESLEIDVDELRLRNLYKVGQRTPFLQEITDDFHVATMLEQLTANSDFEKRKAAIKVFNSKNRFKKRGISKVPCKFGLRCVLGPLPVSTPSFLLLFELTCFTALQQLCT
jgi:xanthine dehydrogenase/oxidase